MFEDGTYKIFQSNMSTEKIEKVTQEQINYTYNLIHKRYMDDLNHLGNKPSEIKDFFSWTNKRLDINIIYFRNKGSVDASFFFSKSEELGTIRIHNLINEKIFYEDLYIPSKEFLSTLFKKGQLNIDPSTILEAGIMPDQVLIGDIGGIFFGNEYEYHLKPLLKAPIEFVDFNNLRLHKDIYNFEEMVRMINNKQFTLELEECIEAYENEKFFVCAAGLGSVLEHLLYLSIEKSVPDQEIKTNENSTASEYIAQLKKEPFNISKREVSNLKGIFAYRNSVSHFNKGIFSKEMCDHLLGGIKICFDNYYQHGNKVELQT